MADDEAPSQSHREPGSGDANAQDSVNLSRPPGPKKGGGLKEKRVPERVITANMQSSEPFAPEDIDDETVIAPGKRMIGHAYANTAQPKQLAEASPLQVAESTGGSDVLALASATQRSGQTVSFKVKGIQWRAGFSKDFAQTPLGHAIHPHPLPLREAPVPDALVRMGIVIRTVNPRLQVVLGQLLPGTFRGELKRARGKCEKLRHLAIFYLPNPQAAVVGFIHEYVPPKGGGATFYFYVQTTVGKAPVGILDEVLRTLEAGLPEGEKSSDLSYDDEDDDLPEKEFDFAAEISQSMNQVRSTFKSSLMVHSAKRMEMILQNLLMDLIKLTDRVVAKIIRGVTVVIILVGNSLPIRALAAVISGLGTGIVKLVWGINKLMLAISRSPLVQGLIKVFSTIFRLIGTVFGYIGTGLSATGRGVVAVFSAPGKLMELSRGGIGALRDGKPKTKKRSKQVAKAKGVSKPKPVAAKATAPKQIGPPKQKAPSPPAAKGSPLGFFEDRPLKK